MRALCVSPLKPQFHLIQTPSSFPIKRRRNPSFPPKTTQPLLAATTRAIKARQQKPTTLQRRQPAELPVKDSSNGDGAATRWMVVGVASLGLGLLLFGGPGADDARALVGPDGPLAEEFWENIRRYGLYILTVSTGAIYTIFEPIAELLKTPITAVLIITVLVGGGFLVSQVLSAMVGISEFSYDYGY